MAGSGHRWFELAVLVLSSAEWASIMRYVVQAITQSISPPIVVQKYGGSSVADVAGIQRVAARIAETREQGKQVCVVVSAMGSTTDELLGRARAISEAPPRRELDMLLTCGERASMALLSMAVSERGYQAISFTGSQSGILTNDRHSGARIIEVRPVRVQDELERGRVVIVAGFQGVSYKREITTLGRGGSDTTAVALAAALNAEYCEICSDVEGVFSADPRVVGAARLIEAISHDEMLELATHGARVLHSEAVEFARRSGIALYARATAKSGGGTRIDRVGAEAEASIGVTGQTHLVRVCRDSPHRAEQILGVLDRTRVALLCVRHSRGPAGADSIAVWFGLDDVPDWPEVCDELTRVAGQDAIADSFGQVSVVGRGLGEDPRTIIVVSRVAAEITVPIEEIITSPLRVTAFCRAGDVDDLVAALHRRFCQ